ncbi:MAG: HAD family hydrolase [Methanomassiliicoccales archaeon]|nr:HAD family hydrolase [Methanomassiliicoccales archaeon]
MSPTITNGLRPQKFKAVVFDLDNTIIQSTIDFREMNRAVAETLLMHGLPKDILDSKGRVNVSIVRVYAYFKTHSQDGWAESLENDLNRVSAEVEMARVDQSRAMPGAFETLEHLGSRGILSAILTRGSRVYTMKALNSSGLNGRFHTIVCRDDHSLSEAKPNPMSLRRVFDDLCLSNEQCLFIGDHETDYLCAKEAGTPFAAVLTGVHGREVWKDLRPEFIIGSIADLPDLLEGNK